MFRIGIVELTAACGIVLLVFIVPVMLRGFYARIDRRLKNIEKKLDDRK